MQAIPKLPMRNKAVTKAYYTSQLGFSDVSAHDFDGYLILQREDIELHFFEFKGLDPLENYGQVYFRTQEIDILYREMLDRGVVIHPSGALEEKPWGMKEFAMLDPDHNLLTFGQELQY